MKFIAWTNLGWVLYTLVAMAGDFAKWLALPEVETDRDADNDFWPWGIDHETG